jgi:hypothetical protein
MLHDYVSTKEFWLCAWVTTSSTCGVSSITFQHLNPLFLGRKPDTIEVQQMKQQAKEERMLRQLEQERLNKETEAREAAEAKQRQYEMELAQMRENMQMKEREIVRAHEQIRELERELLELSKVDLNFTN